MLLGIALWSIGLLLPAPSPLPRARRVSKIAASISAPGTPLTSSVDFVNPLDVAGFAEPNGWGCIAGDASELPLLVFLPGMDGSLFTPFMQYPELGSCFELACLRHVEGLGSRTSFDQLTEAVVNYTSHHLQSGRRVLLMGESFGASLAIAVASKLEEQEQPSTTLAGVVVVNPATSYRRSALATLGPICASLSGPLLYPLYLLSLVALAALVLTPQTQAPAMIATLASLKTQALLCNPYRESYLGRVALSAFLGRRGRGFEIGPLLAIQTFAPEDLAFRLSAWLAPGADVANAALPGLRSGSTPMLALVGDLDLLLPSVDEARRLAAEVGEDNWRGTVVVPGAGHASTLGNRVNVLAEIRKAFAQELSPSLRDEAELTPLPDADEGLGWERGLLDRPYEPLKVDDYVRYARGGDMYPSKL